MYKEVNKDIKSLATLESAEHQKSLEAVEPVDDTNTMLKQPSDAEGLHSLDDTILTAKRKSVL